VPSLLLDDDLRFFQAVEYFTVEQLIASFCGDMPESRQATGTGLPRAIDTSIWRSGATICSALNLFSGVAQAHFLTSLGPKKPGWVNYLKR
jgi:hypothetical protein